MTRWLCVLAVMAACGGSSADDDDEVPTGSPQPTEVGIPIGPATTATIGPEGGMVVAEDATLIVPAGALAAPTEISIQPITNHAWTSPTGAYRLTPDGITFAIPVELQLRYELAALEGSAPGFLSIAYQNAEGFWAVLRSSVVDPAQQHVSVALEHFTDYAVVEGERIVPDDDALRVDERTFVRLNLCFDLEGAAEPLMYPCVDASTSAVFADVATFTDYTSAAANGVVAGDAESGTIPDMRFSRWEYDAPRRVPPEGKNPVAISVPALTLVGQTDLLVTHITILGDEDVWVGTSEVRVEYTGPDIGFANLTVTRATVTWTLDEELGFHVPSGTVDYTRTGAYDNSPNPPCTVSASYTGAIDPITSSLVVNDAIYAGVGVELNVPITIVDSCQGTRVEPTQLSWMPSKMGPIEDDEIPTIQLSEAITSGDITQTVNYRYTKQ